MGSRLCSGSLKLRMKTTRLALFQGLDAEMSSERVVYLRVAVSSPTQSHLPSDI